jgi:hypothetical protein
MYGLNGGTHINPELGYGITFEKRYHKSRTSAIWDRYVMIFCDAGTEFQFGEPFRLVPKISNRYYFQLRGSAPGWWGFHFGADCMACTDLSSVSLAIRPCAGVNCFYGVFQLSYGRSVRLDDHVGIPLNAGNVQLVIKPYIFLQAMRRAYAGK